MRDNRIQEIRSFFLKFQDKKIILYGSGIIARRVIAALEGFSIVGILDRAKMEGDVDGIPLITWDDVDKDTADILIVASLIKNYKEIYNRVVYKCVYRDIEIFGYNGLNISEKYMLESIDPETAFYFTKNREELLKTIDSYDAISFDLFDTLIMRKTLEPVDIFDLVELRLQEKGISVCDFKKKRRTAELKAAGKDIYCIYNILAEILHLDAAVCKLILEEEIQCEKEHLIPRKVMVEVFQYAVSKGKTVSIISNMYLTTAILKDILSAIRIDGYDKIYVSCEYGKGKGNGLFEEYLKDINGKKCLHIGDNQQSDIAAAKKYGIDAYGIKSAYDMLRISNLRKGLIYTNTKCDRLWMGNIISELFNDPFILYSSAGVVHIQKLNMAAKIFFAPIAANYMSQLYGLLEQQHYEGILFGARDGYLLKKIYDSGIMGTIKNKPRSVYFLTSRKLAVKAMIESKEDIEEFIEYLGSSLDAKNILSQMFHTEGDSSDIKQYVEYNLKSMLKESKITRNSYLVYMKKNNIDIDGKYLFCDLLAGGTVHDALNRIFKVNLDGIYLYRQMSSIQRDITIYPVYSEQEWGGNLAIGDIDLTNLFEKIFTAPEPSVIDMKCGGVPVYAKEDRKEEELDMLECMQDFILQEVKRYQQLLKWDKEISKGLACTLFGLAGDVIYDGEAAELYKLKSTDDVSRVESGVLMMYGKSF